MVATRKFDGKRFSCRGKFRKKGNANEKAKAIRNRGDQARVVKVKGGYRVYGHA